MYFRPLLCLIAIFGLTNIADAAPFAYITNTGSGSGVDTVSVIDTSNNSVVKTVPIFGSVTSARPAGVAVNAAGNRVYVSNKDDKSISVIDSSTIDNNVIDTISRTVTPGALAVNPAGSRLYVANETSGSVSVINPVTKEVYATVTVGSGPMGIAVNADGTRVYVANNGDGTVSIIDANDGSNTYTKEPTDITVGANPVGIAFNPTNSKVYVANIGNSVSVITTPANTVTTIPLETNASPAGVAVSADGSKVYVTENVLNKVAVINVAGETVSSTFSTGNSPWGVAFNPQNSLVYVANYLDNNITSYDVSGVLSTDPPGTVSVGTRPEAIAIGPMMYPITQTVTGCGSVAPAAGSDSNFLLKGGASQVFTITPNADCVTRSITVDGGSQNPSLTSWSFDAISSSHALSVDFGYPIVTVTKTGLGSGTVTTTAPNANLNCGTFCSADYPVGTSVTLHAAAIAPSSFTGWTGAGCSGTGDCTFTITADTAVTANFDVVLGGDVKVLSSGLFYQTIAEAYAALTGSDTIMVKATYAGKESVSLANAAKNLAIDLKGGYDDSFATQTGRTTINSIDIQYGTITVDKLDMQFQP